MANIINITEDEMNDSTVVNDNKIYLAVLHSGLLETMSYS